MNDDVRVPSDIITMNEDKGSINFKGIDIKISDIIGEKLVNQYFAQLKDDDIKTVFTKIDDMVFEKYHENGEEYKKLKERMIDSDSWNRSYKDTPLWKFIQNQYEETFKEKIKEEINRRFQEEDFIKKVNEAADTIIEYAVEGYKEDMIKRIRERMVGNIFDACPSYGNESLLGVIHHAIDDRLHY